MIERDAARAWRFPDYLNEFENGYTGAVPRETGLTSAQTVAIADIRRLVGTIVGSDGRPAAADRRLPGRHDRSASDAGIDDLLDGSLAVPDDVRDSRVVLIDGGRGSGKTTVLVSLCKQWSREVRDGRTTDIAVLPLPIVGLQTLPPHAELAAVLVGLFKPLHDAVAHRVHPAREDDAWLPDAARPKRSNLSRSWEELQRALAGWSGHAVERRARISPDEYWWELANEAGVQAGLFRKFQRYVDTLSTVLSESFLGKHATPVFVLPIDDADMNPHRAGELADILRSLYHRQVFTLLTGDTELFDIVLRRHMLGALWQPLRQIPLGPATKLVDQDEYVVRVAREAYDRTVPPAHRFKLPALRPEERWPAKRTVSAAAEAQESPARLVDDGPFPPRALRKLLEDREQIRPTLPGGPLLADYFAPPRATADDDALPMRLADVLPDRLRGFHEVLGELAGKLRRAGQPIETHETVVWLWHRALEQHATGEVRRALARVVQLAPRRGRQTLVITGGRGLRWEAGREIAATIERSRVRMEARTPATVRLIFGDDDLPAPIAETLKLAIDLAGEQADAAGFVGAPLFPAISDGLFGATVVELETGTHVSLPWPVPAWRRFITLGWFWKRWGYRAAQQNVADGLVCDLISAALGAPRVGVTQPDPGWVEHTWSSLADEWSKTDIAASDAKSRAAGSLNVDHEASRRWLQDALVLLAPEFGVQPIDAAKALEPFLGRRDSVRELCARAGRYREKLLRDARATVPEDDRPAFDALRKELWSDPEHPFLRLTSAPRAPALVGADAASRHREPSPPGSEAALQNRPSIERAWGVNIPYPDLTFIAVPKTLWEYATWTSRRRALVRKASEEPIVVGFATIEPPPSEPRTQLLARVHRAALESRHALGDIEHEPGSDESFVADPAPTSVGDPEARLEIARGAAAILRRLVAPKEELTSAATAMKSLAERVATDLRSALWPDTAHPGIRPWPGLEIVTPGVWRWPAPVFPGCLDQEVLEEGWNAIVEKIAERIAELGPSVSAAGLLDVVGFSWARLVLGVSRERKVRPGIIAPRAADWLDLLEEVWRESKSEIGMQQVPRYRSFDAWRHHLVLMAAPESGLSSAACEALLDATAKVARGGLHVPAADDLRRGYAEAFELPLRRPTSSHPWTRRLRP